jgi:arylsulfatase A-like enzyme
MPANQVTIAEILKDAGYRTALFGKWHLGSTLPISPNAQGFDEFLGHKVGCIDNYSHFFYWSGANRHDLWLNEKEHFEDGKYFPDIIVREAKRFIKENQDRPFFLYLPFNTPHYPLQAEQRFWDMYKDMTDIKRKRYATFVTSLDEKIGQIIQTLNELNLRKQTLIIFLSDHGHSVEERTFGGGGSAGPYRGHKFTLWEGGIRVPCIMSWPGHIPEDEVRDQIACSIDLLPTIAGYCNVEIPSRKLDGRDIQKVIDSENAQTPHNILYWMKGENWAVRKGPWKLVYQDKETFLSNMDIDVTESENLVEANAMIVEELNALHHNWLKEVGNQ